VQVTATAPATSTITISTTGPNAYLAPTDLRRGIPVLYAVMLPIFGLALLGVELRSEGKGRQKLFGLAISCVLLGGFVFQLACGGSGSSGSGGTPAGTYTVNVTAATGSIHHAASLTFVVQ
jgi:hypothetical protein